MDWADLPPEALTTIAKGAYYSTKITDKLKLISFNSDYGSVSKNNKAVSSYTSVCVIVKMIEMLSYFVLPISHY